MCVLTMNYCKNDMVSLANNEAESLDSSSSTSSSDLGNSRFLPEDFEPTEKEVILGRGKQIASHPGNKQYKEIVLSHIKEYSAAQTKALKSSILSHIVNKIRSNSAYQAGFVKQDGTTGRWTIAEDSAARIATAQIFRDALHDNYKSSKAFKQQRRQDRKGLAKKQKELREAGKGQQSLVYQHQGGMMFQQRNQAAYPAPIPSFAGVQQAPGVQDQLVGQLNSVLEQLKGDGSLSSIFSTPLPVKEEAFEFNTAAAAVPAVNDNHKESETVAILFDHFGSKLEDPTTNPYEPTPISDDAVILNNGQDGFRLRQPLFPRTA